ncbi:MAG: hypothetical protein HFE44_09545 [Oscillospiraceae bacterium]|nr:hypothetical protein [Oscillospiraceae bacterium]
MKHKDGFLNWFDGQSGYSLHSGRVPDRRICKKCCGREPENACIEAVIENRATPERRQLYRCPVCQRWYFREGGRGGGYVPAGSLLQYRLVKGG